MRVIRCPDAQTAAETAAQVLRRHIAGHPETVLGLATGGTMLPLYAALAEGGGPDMRRVTTFNLDEYVGLAASDRGSYRHYMQHSLLGRLAQPPSAVHIPQGDARDPAVEARRYEALIAASGGIDLQLLGLGRNGHIGFNEPGSGSDTITRVVTLSAATRAANARYFAAGGQVPERAISMGIATILRARACLLLATGAAKAEAVARLVAGPVGAECPATFLRNHPDVTVVLDSAAAAQLEG